MAGVLIAIGLAVLTICTLRTLNRQVREAVRANHDLETQFEEQQRPWVKVGLRIVQPLTFGVPAWQGPVAEAKIEVTMENVGQEPAVDLVDWEDIIPVGENFSMEAAELRQKQWCDANRNPKLSPFLTGQVVFPKDHHTVIATVGPPMKTVMDIAAKSSDGKVSLVLVGCVSYRASYQPETSPAHETRFLYYLGMPQNNGAFLPAVFPKGVAKDLTIIGIGKFSAD